MKKYFSLLCAFLVLALSGCTPSAESIPPGASPSPSAGDSVWVFGGDSMWVFVGDSVRAFVQSDASSNGPAGGSGQANAVMTPYLPNGYLLSGYLFSGYLPNSTIAIIENRGGTGVMLDKRGGTGPTDDAWGPCDLIANNGTRDCQCDPEATASSETACSPLLSPWETPPTFDNGIADCGDDYPEGNEDDE